MKKLFTLFAFLACFLGAKAEWVEDYKVDYSNYSGFPFYVMGFVPEWVDGVMTDMGGNFEYAALDNTEGKVSDVTVKTNNGTEYYKIEKTEGTWHQYFIADGIPTELDGAYTVKAMVKASEACTVPVNFQWGWGEGQRVSSSLNVGTEWAEVEMDVSGIGGTSCALIAQPNTAAIIEWKYVIVGHNAKPQKPITWLEQLENGTADKTWEELGLADVKYDDMENNYKICAWAKQKGTNVNEETGGSDPFPATIENIDGNNVFVVHGAVADTEGDAAAWDNQFWIQSQQPWKEGTQLKISFRYKASKACKTNTQMHNQKPSDYKIWYAIGDVNFTTEWQNFEKVFTIDASQANTWSIAFNLNPDVKEAVDFYFDDLSWQIMKLDEGYFVAGANAAEGLDYDLDNAIEFVEEDGLLVATVGEKGAYVSQVMISTIRGNDAAFKGATLKPKGTIVNDPDTWLDYESASLAKLNLPGAGIWKIYLDTYYNAMAFEMLEGNIVEPIEINPNPTEVVVKGQERDWRGTDNDGNPIEEQVGEGQPWDNQFFIIANRALSAGEVTVVEFDYVSTVDAKTTTQCHNEPGGYMHWNCIGDVKFTTEEQHFSYKLTVPSEADGMKSIAFNMAEIKGACDYTIKNIVWKLEDGTESLIDQTGTKNFYVKEGAGTAPYQFGTDPDNPETGITNVVDGNSVSGKTFNLAGQAVSKNFKGIVVKNGKKLVVE
ncbi:MAG: hypothetical protein MR802_05915 [Prevotella sp.]|nr:hypothetical protein [Prevotella sp.]